jgi:alpha-beta hydrolase superfamily lysophospholipase
VLSDDDLGPALDVGEFYVNENYPMYVQRWAASKTPVDPSQRVILVHGGAHTGQCWTRCPDGRPGWAQHLARRGWTTFVVDWPGMGRSRREPDFLTAGPTPIVDALRRLLHQEGPAVIIGHSIGAAISAKVIDGAPHLVRAFVAVAPAEPGNVESDRPLASERFPLSLTADVATRLFTRAPRFPHDATVDYLKTICDYSPSVQNALGDLDRSGSLVINDASQVAAVPSLVLAGDDDQLTTSAVTLRVAEFLKAEHIMAGRDWGMFGFGHMMPIETGSERLLDRVVDWIDHRARPAATLIEPLIGPAITPPRPLVS